MKKISYCLSILALSALSAQANLITNGGFESGTGSWAIDGGATGLGINTTIANSGSQSGEFGFPNVDLSGLKQAITITAADRQKTYELSFSVNLDAVGYEEGMGIRAYVAEGTSASNWTDWHDGGFEWIPKGTTGWNTYTREFTTISDSATHYLVLFKYYPWAGDAGKVAGSVLMDDISLRVIPEPADFALLGGLLALGSVMIRRRR